MVTAVLSGLGSHNGHTAYAFHATGAMPVGTATVDDRAHVNVVTSGGRSEYVEYGNANDHTHQVHASPVVMEREETNIDYATPLILDGLPESIASWTESVADTECLTDFDDTKPNYSNVLSGTETQGTDGSYRASGAKYDVPIERLRRAGYRRHLQGRSRHRQHIR